RAGIAGAGDDGLVHRWEARADAEDVTLRGHRGAVRAVTFDVSGERLASGGDDRTVRIWHARTGAELAVLTGHPAGIYRLAWSHDGTLIAAAGDQQVYVWEVKTGKKVAVLAHASVVYGLAFSPDGTRLATGCRDNTIRLWDLAKFEEVAELRGHTVY